MNILVVKLSAIGDVVHTLPSLKELRRLYPDAHITWLIEEDAADLIEGHPLLNKVLVSRRKRWMRGLLGFSNVRKTLREIRSFLKELRERRYDLVIDFQGLFKSAILVFLSGGKRRLGYKKYREMTFLFYNETIREDMGKHAVDRYLDMLVYLGARLEKPEFCIPINENDRRYIEDFFRTSHISSDDPIVSVNPIALWKTKLWGVEKFALLCEKIVDELNVKVVITGRRKRGMIEDILARTNNKVTDISGKTSLRELACLYQYSDLIITTDSGPMHIAAAVNSPVIALFGPTTYLRTGPYGEGHTIITGDLPCSPCFKKNCSSIECMEKITIDEVFHAVKRQVRLHRKGPLHFSESPQPLSARH